MTTVDPLPTPVPTRSESQELFDSHADQFLGALPLFGEQINVVASEVNALAASAAVSAGIAATHKDTAANSAAQAAASAQTAQTAAGAAPWASGASYTVGQVVWSPITYLSYRRVISGAGTTDPSLDAINWALASSGAPQLIETAAASVTAQANGHYVLTSAGAQEVVLPASPPSAALIWVTVSNDRIDNVIRRSGNTINGIAEDLILDDAACTVALRYISTGWRVLQ